MDLERRGGSNDKAEEVYTFTDVSPSVLYKTGSKSSLLYYNSCFVLGVYSRPSSHPYECRSVDPLCKSVTGHSGHEPVRFSLTDPQVRIHTQTENKLTGSN